MVLMNGIMTERMDIVKSDWFVPASIAERSTRQNTGSQNVKLTFGRLEQRKNFYTVRTTKTWNEIPASIKMQKRHDQFKKKCMQIKEMARYNSYDIPLSLLPRQPVPEQTKRSKDKGSPDVLPRAPGWL